MNFFTDNPDLAFIFEHANLDAIITAYEDGFREYDRFDYAPSDYADARDSYHRVLVLAGDLAARIVAPLGKALDDEHTTISGGATVYNPALVRCVQALKQAGLMGCCISRTYGGLNFPAFIFTMLIEIISRADAGLQNVFALQGIAGIIETFAGRELKEKYLPLFAQGRVTGAMALTEEEAGSDLQNVKMCATEQPDGSWRLNGVKRFITNGGAEVLLVLARSEIGTTDGLGLSLFLCEAGPAITVRRIEDKLGIHSSPTCELVFHDTPAFLIGDRQRGLMTYVLSLLNGARLATAAQAIGIAQAAFSEALAYARLRKQYGRRIEQLPAVAAMLIGMQMEIEASRALTCETARIMDLSRSTEKRLAASDLAADEKKQLKKEARRYERSLLLLTSLAKYYCSEMSLRVTSTAMQVLGGSGYMRDYPVEKYYRDARITTIYEGTSQLQVMSAFRGILSGAMEKYFEELAAAQFAPPQEALAKRLQHSRELLQKSVELLNAGADKQLMDLCSRDLVDIACDITIGYLLLQQSEASQRKQKMAGLFINDREHVIKMRAQRIKSADTLLLQEYADLLGG
jgi:3-(methylthio)propanoyl-CoA dehydrogenase